MIKIARLASHKKKIACLEGDWGDWYSVTPLLQLLKSYRRVGYVHYRCRSLGRLRRKIRQLGRSKGYDLIYLAFHGRPGTISTNYDDVTLEELAEICGTRLRGRVIHFGSCSTLRCEPERVIRFLQATQVSMVTGFDKKVDWIEAAAFELAYFDLWQEYKMTKSFDASLRQRFRDLVDRLGYVSFHL